MSSQGGTKLNPKKRCPSMDHYIIIYGPWVGNLFIIQTKSEFLILMVQRKSFKNFFYSRNSEQSRKRFVQLREKY